MLTSTVEEQYPEVDIIRRSGYTTVRRFPDGFITFNGPRFTFQNHVDAMEYEFKEHDLVICTYPKSGTTWTQNIVHLLLNSGEQYSNNEKTLMDEFEFLEITGTKKLVNGSKLIKTHYCPGILKYKSNKSKWIVVMRNPKDTAVSLYFHSKSERLWEFGNGKWDHWLHQFLNINQKSQNYFYWINSWLPYLANENVCFLTYEEMTKDQVIPMDPESAIRKLANHIGGKALATVESAYQLEKVIVNQQFENMKKNSDNIVPKELFKTWDHDQSTFLRKGIVGDWMNYFSKEQSDAVDEMFNDQFQGTIAETWWKEDFEWN